MVPQTVQACGAFRVCYSLGVFSGWAVGRRDVGTLPFLSFVFLESYPSYLLALQYGKPISRVFPRCRIVPSGLRLAI